MATFNVTGTATNVATGQSATLTGSFVTTAAPPVISSITVVPQSAAAGTLRTITINATDPQGGVLTYTCLVNGAPATATAQPNVFTYTA